jgi:uncharacterized damage-inducible protein DinB
MSTSDMTSRERADLLESLAMCRQLLRRSADGLTEEQARLQPTVSELSVGGIIKHVAAVEQKWSRFMVDGTGMEVAADIDWSNPDPKAIAEYKAGFRLADDESLVDALVGYAEVAAATDDLVRTLDDLDRSFPLPVAPWFPLGSQRTVRRTIQHIIAETAQHAGHADIIRETIDGSRSMG